MSPISRQEGTRDMVAYRSEADEDLGYLEENMQCLTVGILDVTTDDLLRHYQCHTTGVSGWISKLLRGVAQAIICYHEHRQEDD